MNSESAEGFYSYSEYLQKQFGARTYKVVVSSGLTCPTRDGTLGKKACAFCDLRGSSSFYGKKGRGQSITEQLNARLPAIRERFSSQKFLAYFQSYTNTYSDDADFLEEIYDAAITHPEISGLCIGTRPGCLPDESLDLLERLARRKYVSLELGVQSFEDPTLLWLDRGHDTRASLDALERLRNRAPSVHVCAHLIFGSPTDSANAPEEAARILNQSAVQGVKLHQLMVLKHTELERRWKEEGAFPVLSLEQYTQQVARFLEHLSPKIYVERLHATSSHPEECIAPAWSKNRWEPHNFIRSWFAQNQIRQGARLG
ncbi:MAG: TIGR01212 family radical SAM protein [Bdellovibrionales bacterium]|nr:TIGR01212 family radical SAM protein [Bdellovibrionales bacterium]